MLATDTPISILRRVIAKVEASHWTTGNFRRTLHGKVRGCLIGLVNMECGHQPHDIRGLKGGATARARLVQEISKTIPKQPFEKDPIRRITRFNDSSTRKAVLKVLNNTENRLKARSSS